jgi:hypothetical protein
MFSNGQGDGTDVSPSLTDAWNIGFDNNGYLYVKNNGVKFTVNDKLYTDNNWYHFAFVVNRKGNANIYINGELKTSDYSNNLGALVAADMSIGARRKYIGGLTTYDQHFIGRIDDFRVWRLARTAKLITLDMNSKLSGDELGLSAYYPFDKYDVNLVIQPSLQDCDKDDYTGVISSLIATANNGSNDNVNVPNIKDARPVQKIQAFNWVTNNDKIVINLEDDPALIEKCVLTFTVDKVEDLQENRMASPVTWTAYINKNTVIWAEDYKEFEKVLYDPLSFTVNIENIGGTEQNYQITNLPSWLTVDEPSGTLLPQSSKIITFTVDSYTNIGNYEVSVFLTSNFGYNEKLNINLKIYQTPPDWDVDVNNFQYSMGVIGQIKIDGRFSTNPDDIIVAFVGEECRGVAHLQYVKNYDMFEAYINIYSNTEAGENIIFKIWNATLGKTHVDVTPTLTFENNSIVGTPATPQIFETTNSLLAEIQLVNGWRWVSFNLNTPNLTNVNTMFAQINAIDGNAIKGQTVFDVYNSGLGWLGSLSNSGGFKNENMYMVKLSSEQILMYSGANLDVNTVQINLNQGWNWIGYTPNVNIEVNDAFANYSPNSGDIIKSQFNFAVYDVNLGWVGSLTFMNPGKGYMYKNTNTVTTYFFYPESGIGKFENLIQNDEFTKIDGISFNPDLYELNSSMIAIINTDQIITDNHFLVAFVGEECRGYISPVDLEGYKMFFLTIYANTSYETFNFKLFNSIDNSYTDLNEIIVFEANSMFGELEEPFEFTLNNTVSSLETVCDIKVDIMPNPTNGKFNIKFNNFNNNDFNDNSFLLQISDITGRIIFTTDKYSENILIDFTDKTSSVYTIRVDMNGTIYTKILIKK